ncbi:5-dehydro-2-deoxygluconokinase [Paenibacillus camelliae]|uniref:5-dehydro-2-deoxygluconokinase n=1 Tax=Paenibacillus camelliae TaxID=512410 RepID=UPI00204026EB|nr:5-dehydro-2-deoxygluconokinase [Paenibacillus camelliae]MCM3633894.1 5-dehydro-2-deoxygluconokinase [Paenibacillus camelliae]
MLQFNASKPLDFIALGRLCIDLNANEIHRPMEDTVTFTKYVGGSPANITIAAAKLGLKSGFIGRISDDQHGRFIKHYLEQHAIDTSNVIVDRSGSVTGLAFTEIKSPTDCSILMYRDNVADLKLEPGDINEAYISSAKALLISGTALAKSPSREAALKAVELAKQNGVVVMFDIDYRGYTWSSKEEAGIYASLIAEKSDVIFGGRDEFMLMELMLGREASDEQIAHRWLDKGAALVVIKHGGDGSVVYTSQGEQYTGRIYPANVVKTFGAGDSYAGAFIYGLMNGVSIPTCQQWGAAAASIVVASHSCSDAMPTFDQITELIKQHGDQGEVLK